MIYPVDDTIVAVASAPGGAARGVIRLSGPHVLDCLLHWFRPESPSPPPRALPTSRAGVLQLSMPIGDVPCRAYVWPTSRSYTRQPTAEVHMLGCTPLLDAALDHFCQSGARLAEPGEFTLRAFLAGRLDLTQAEAVLGVIDATDQRQLKVALNQLAGGLSGSLDELRGQLLDLCADIEAGLDFADEDIEFVSARDVHRQLDRIMGSLNGILAQIHERGETRFDLRVALRGRPNVGKSTLWNSLVRDATAITSEQPGTTRDYLEGFLEIDGLECTLIDTAGVDAALSSSLDDAAQAMTGRIHREADLSILCLDAASELTAWDASQLLSSSQDTVIVLTKCDLPLAENSDVTNRAIGIHVDHEANTLRLASPDGIKEYTVIPVSARTGAGLSALRATLRDRIEIQMNSESGVVAQTAARCHESLRRAQSDLGRAVKLAAGNLGDELVAAEIRNAMNELGKVVGTIYTDDVLDRIFSRFCIGK